MYVLEEFIQEFKLKNEVSEYCYQVWVRVHTFDLVSSWPTGWKHVLDGKKVMATLHKGLTFITKGFISFPCTYFFQL